MDEGGENRRHRVDYYKVTPWNVIPQYQMKEQNSFHMNAKIGMLCHERDAAIRDRDRALAGKKAALDERDAAIKQRDAAISDRDNALRERDNAIAALQFQESTMNALFQNSGRELKKRTNHQIQEALALVPSEPAKCQESKRAKKLTKIVNKLGEDLNRRVTKAEWDAGEFGAVDHIQFNESTMPGPVCSCTGVRRQCYKWGNGGWQSSCCTTALSEYPLPQMPNKRHSRMGGRKMSGSVFSRLLARLATGGHDLSIPVDLKNYWAKHGTNRYITIK